MTQKSNIVASQNIISLLEKLMQSWSDWDEYGDYYFNQLLPELKNNTSSATQEEKRLINAIKNEASPQEWKNLEKIARDLRGQRLQFARFAEIINRMLSVRDFSGAENYVAKFDNDNLLTYYTNRRGRIVEELFNEILNCLDSFDFQGAEDIILPYKAFLSKSEIVWYKNSVELAKDRKFNEERKKVVERTKTEIKAAFSKFDIALADSLYQQLSDQYPDAVIVEFEDWLASSKQREFKSIARALLKQYSFKHADQLYQQYKQYVSEKEYRNLKNIFIKRQKRERKQKFLKDVDVVLRNFAFSDADHLYLEYKEYISEGEYTKIKFKYKKLFERSRIEPELEKFHFTTADSLFEKSEHLQNSEYQELKEKFIIKFVEKYFPNMSINQEQVRAVASTSPNLLVKARAGSGKTRVIASKTAVLLGDTISNADQVMILAFNHNAAKEIRKRLKRQFGYEHYENARTFHSLAWHLVQPTQKPLFDEKGETVSTNKLSLFVQGLLKTIWNPAFQEQLYTMFRHELRQIEDAGILLNEEDYYIYRRSFRQTTLCGERVKSAGEKWIADFLFEHDIDYTYEKVWAWDDELYRPDFSLSPYDYVIEHWGIDENHPGVLPSWWDKSWEEYREEMDAKRAYSYRKGVTLIETSVADMQSGRAHFEKTLKQRLTGAGIECKRLAREKLITKVKADQLSHFAKLCVQFIQKAKKQRLSAAEIRKRIKTYPVDDERTDVFLKLAVRVYLEYERETNRLGIIDFDDLLNLAIQTVEETEGACSIKIKHQRNIRMDQLKWILIDEYQDFSELSYQLVYAIQRFNPDVRIFCVGDDWQAINAFAGSNLRFFEGFSSLVQGGEVAHLLINHRSKEKIIQTSNTLMQELGRPATALPNNKGGLVKVEYIDNVWIELRNGDEYSDARTNDKKFRFFEKRAGGSKDMDNRSITAKYLKKCYEIITDPGNIGKTFAVLSRTRRIHRATLGQFEAKLKSCFSDEEKKKLGNLSENIRVKTVQSFKGLEADIAIILNVCNGAFPLIHPNNVLFKIFGQDEQAILAEERRLFYVALTRAKEKVYLLTEKDRKSDFLDKLPN